jgi:regulator of protease activity HflC (stomatin/prohibitin superfamily)
MLDELLAEREKINRELQQIIDLQTEPWGIKVSVVEVRDVELPQSMQRAMARQAEAEREKRAKIIHAEGEYQASQQLALAADVIHQNPVTIQLRYLQTLTEIGAEKNTTVVFPLPLEFLEAMTGGSAARRPAASGGTPQTAQPAQPAQPAAPTTLRSVPPPLSESPIAEPPVPPEQQ